MGRKENKQKWAEDDAVFQENKVVFIDEDDFDLDDGTSEILGLNTSLYQAEGESDGDWFERVFDEI